MRRRCASGDGSPTAPSSRLLPTYDVFDEDALLRARRVEARLLEVHGVRIGVSVCEDVWNDPDL